MNNNGEPGKKCPKCGAEGRYNGEHETAVRIYQVPGQTIVDVGWRCWNCGYEWGFDLVKILGIEWQLKLDRGYNPMAELFKYVPPENIISVDPRDPESIRAAAEEIAKRMKEQRSEAER